MLAIGLLAISATENVHAFGFTVASENCLSYSVRLWLDEGLSKFKSRFKGFELSSTDLYNVVLHNKYTNIFLMTFKSAREIFIISSGFIGFSHAFFDLSLVWLLLPGVSFLMLLIYGSACIQSNFFIQVDCHKKSGEKQIALSFDDGPNPEFTPQVLALLAEYNATATFFVIGKNIPGNENILKQIDEAGHSIGNHSYTHSKLF